MRILHVGSKSIHVSSFIERMHNDVDTVSLLVEEPCGFTGVNEEVVLSFRSKNPIIFVQQCLKLRRFLADSNFSVIHIHQINRLAFLVTLFASKLKLPVLTTAWGTDVLVMPNKNFLYRYIVQKTLQRSACVTADSQEMIAAMQAITTSTTYELLQYGIEPVDGGIKQKIVYSNRLHKPLYRINVILDYFNEFLQVNSDWRLIVAGSGNETEALRRKVKELGIGSNVDFVGWLDATSNRDYYKKASIYVSIPESDGTSVSLLESMSAGCIPVVSDLKVSKEWIVDGVNGIIEEKGINPLIRALELDVVALQTYNKELIEKKATKEVSIARFSRLYDEIL